MKHPPIPGPLTSQQIETDKATPLHFTGPPLSEGPLPAFFYFALAGDESLTLDPYNQVVAYLYQQPMRCWSLTIPGHGPNFDKTRAIHYMMEEMLAGRDVLGNFFNEAEDAIRWAINAGHVDPERLALGGLSRGGLVATHLAARLEEVEIVLGFAPLTYISALAHSPAIADNPLIQGLSLDHLIPQLLNKKLRYYIGNRDMRVSTDLCFQFIRKLTDTAFTEGIRSPSIDLIIGPSMGFKGHGTAPSVFYSGAQWLSESLLP